MITEPLLDIRECGAKACQRMTVPFGDWQRVSLALRYLKLSFEPVLNVVAVFAPTILVHVEGANIYVVCGDTDSRSRCFSICRRLIGGYCMQL